MIVAYLVSHALAVVWVFASLVMVIRLFGTRRTSQSTLAWLLALVFMPFVAIPLYLLIGSRKFPKRAKGPPSAVAVAEGDSSVSIAHVLRASSVAPPRDGNAFELLTTGEAAYARLMELVRGAERSIDITMFILSDDETGRAVVDALVERAAKGVSVRMILDAVGSRSSLRRAARLLGAVGGEVRSFMPFGHSPIRGRTNLRSHRKLAVFDGERVFTGGMNLANEYMGPKSAPRWVDLAAVTSGPIGADSAAVFESDWVFCGGSRRPPAAHLSKAVRGDAIVQLVPSGPDMATDTIYDLFLMGIFGAKERVAIVTPYYVPDETLQHALVLSARRGVRTELVVPSRSNHRIADIARRQLLRELVAAGVTVHYYARGMVHAKAMVVDDVFAYVGSPNFDMRSLFLNYENALMVYSRGAIAPIVAFIDGLIEQCSAEGPRERERWLVERLARLLAPEL